LRKFEPSDHWNSKIKGEGGWKKSRFSKPLGSKFLKPLQPLKTFFEKLFWANLNSHHCFVSQELSNNLKLNLIKIQKKKNDFSISFTKRFLPSSMHEMNMRVLQKFISIFIDFFEG